MSSVVHFEVSADQVERAVKFYTKVFGWRIYKEEGAEDYWLIETGTEEEPGTPGALMERIDPSDSTIITFDVPSVDGFARRITEAGGTVLAPKLSIPGAGYVQYCSDTEGNTFGIMQFDESAQ